MLGVWSLTVGVMHEGLLVLLRRKDLELVLCGNTTLDVCYVELCGGTKRVDERVL